MLFSLDRAYRSPLPAHMDLTGTRNNISKHLERSSRMGKLGVLSQTAAGRRVTVLQLHVCVFLELRKFPVWTVRWVALTYLFWRTTYKSQ